MSVVEEAVAEELLSYKAILQQLCFNKIMKQLLHLVFVFTASANLVWTNSCADMTNSNAKVSNSIANGTNSNAKATNYCKRDEVICKGDKFNCKNL